MVVQIVVVALLLAVTGPAQAAPAAIASADPQATAAGIAVLEQGGNAFAAAVAVSATLAVVEPFSSGLGGGGFWLLHRARDDHDVMIDGRETAKLLESIFRACRLEIILPDKLPEPAALQEFIEEQCRKFGV